MFFLLLFFAFLLGNDATTQVPRVLQTPNVGVNDKQLMQVSLEVSQHVQPELGIPWLSVYLPVKSCHIILKDKTGTFSPPSLNSIETNNWCNWTIWAGPHKHILIYIKGFEGTSNCDDSQDRILFQGILSSTENKVVYACRNHGTLIFATQAVAVYVVFLSEASSQNQSHKHFKGRYYIFDDYVNSTNGEKSVLKSNSHVASKSYVLPTGHSLNSTVTTQMLGQENWLPVTNEKIIKTGTETFSKLAVGKYMHVSLLKSTKTVSLNPFDLKRRQVTKPSIDNSRILNKSPMLVLDSNDAENEEKTFTHKPGVYSNFLDMTHNLQMMTKLEATKNHGAITESVTPQNDGHLTTRWMTTHMKDTEGKIKNATTFPQVSLEEQRIPVQSLKSIPTQMQKQMLQMLLPNSEVSKKKADPTESPPHLEQTKIYKGEQTGIQVSTAENGNTAVQITSRILNKSPTLVLDSNDAENEEKFFTHKPEVYSDFLDMTHNLQMMTKLEATKNHGAITESVTPQNDGHLTTRWMRTHMKGTEGKIKNATTFPQVSLEEQRIPVQSLKSIPTQMQKQMLQMLLPNSEVSKKKADPTESPPHLEQTKIYKGEQMGIQVSTAENGNTAVQITVSEGIKASPSKSTMETKFHQTSTLASTDRHPTPSLRSFNDYLTSISTTVNPQAMPSNCLMRTQINTAFTTQYKKSVNKNREYLQKKRTKTTPLYSSSSWLPTSSILLKVKNKSYDTNPGFRSHENYFVLNSQHKPGDLLFEIVFEIEYKGQLPPVGSTLEKAFIDSIKHQVQERVKLFSNKIKEFKLKEITMRKEETEMDRQNGPNLIFAFWLHLTSEEKNISYLLNVQLEDLSGAFVGAGKVQNVLVRDVNECNSGIDLCGNEAICLNGDGTYSCQCKEGYEDRSLTKLGTLCVRHPLSGLDSLYSYTEFIVGITVSCITVFVVVISVLCTIIKKRRIKRDMRARETALPGMPAEPQPTTFDHNNIRQLLTLDPAQLKIRAKQPELPLQLRTGPTETYRVSIEQSERL